MMHDIDFDDPDYNNSFELRVSDSGLSFWKKVCVTISKDDVVEKVYEFSLCLNSSDGTYSILSMPHKCNDELYSNDKMILKSEKCAISFPMFSGVSNDYILLVLARCVMFDAHIRINKEFIRQD